MSYRFTGRIYIKRPIPISLQNRLTDIMGKIRTLKEYASKINPGRPEEEDTAMAKYYISHVDEGGGNETPEDI